LPTARTGGEPDPKAAAAGANPEQGQGEKKSTKDPWDLEDEEVVKAGLAQVSMLYFCFVTDSWAK